MVNFAVFIMPLCSHLFMSVHTESLNTTEGNTTGENTVVARLRTEGSDYWTEWYDVDDPYGDSGDFETTDAIVARLGTRICPSTHRITKAECKVDEDDDDGRKDILRRRCTTEGLICINRDQTTRQCHDYHVRFFCDLNENGEIDDNSSRRRTPSFDMRIYIILAAVPVVIFFLRILWSCTFERRRRRLRRHLRARRSARPEDSIDPEVFMPPPSYQELFGEGEGPFSLSRRYSLCTKCKSAQCAIFRNRQRQTTVSQISDNSPRSSVTQMSDSAQEASQNGDESTSSGSTSSDRTNDTTQSVGDVLSENQTEGQTHQTSASGSVESRNQNQNSDHLVSSRTNDPRVNAQIVEPTQCECPCHKSATEVMSYVNPAYTPDVEFHGRRTSRLPGMHLSVFSLFRSPSESSLTEPPPPTYKEALKILKKNQDGSS